MAKIVLDRVSKVFGSDVIAVNNVSLEIGDGEFMVLVGPSGCGKSTILRILAGLEEVTAGEVIIGDTQVTDLPPKERDVAMVFQNYALYPHMTVEQNLGFGLRLRKTPKVELKRRVDDVATILGLDPLMQRKPGELSGGQRQRVAMGRAMVREPQAFLMDEPLSNLDAKLRVQMRAQLSLLHDRLATTTIYVTHDQVEAMTLGQRVAVLKDGILQQVDTPQNLYMHPANLFVGAFIGSPPMNLVEAQVSQGRVSFAGYDIALPPGYDLPAYQGRTVILGIRPSDMEDVGRVEERPVADDRRRRRGDRGAGLRGQRDLHRGRSAGPHGGHDQGRVGRGGSGQHVAVGGREAAGALLRTGRRAEQRGTRATGHAVHRRRTVPLLRPGDRRVDRGRPRGPGRGLTRAAPA